MNSAQRIFEILDATPDVAERPDAKPVTDLKGEITLKNVTFGYESGKPVLKDVSFTVQAGTTLGILGGTGSGKSTLIQLLDKLYPVEEGSITVGGVSLFAIRTQHLRKNIGIVLQEPYLFSRTIAENIGITDPAIPEEQIRQAAEAACLHEAVEGFANGYRTFVGERGVTLSGGQKQRAAIARALVQNAPIMVFDDSLSAVDTETDAKIRAALEQRFGTATVILISHRITTLSKADQIIVLENGRIAERGTHETLKAAGGIYQKIYETQSGGAEV